MNKSYVNRIVIETITLSDVYESSHYVYKEERMFLGMIIKESGIYGGGTRFCECEDKYFVKDKKVFRKPRVIIDIINGVKMSKHFETYGEAEEWANSIMKTDYIEF